MGKNPSIPKPLSIIAIVFVLLAVVVVTPDSHANIFDKLKKQLEKTAKDLKNVDRLLNPDKVEESKEEAAAPPATPQQANQGPQVAVQANPNASSSIPDDEALIWSKQEFFFEQGEYFDSMPFSFGEYRKVVPQDSDTFAPLYISTHKGLPRLGVLPKILPAKSTAGYSSSNRNRKHVVAERLQRDNAVYFILALLDLEADEATNENIKLDKGGGPANQNKNPRDIYVDIDGVYRPRYHIQSLASGLLSPKGYATYFAQSEDSINSRMPSRSSIMWGGANPFNARKSFFKFVDQEVPKLKDWSKANGPNVFVVGSIFVEKYDFKRKGIEVALMPPKFSGFVYRHYDGPNEAFFNANSSHKVLLKIDSAEAEKILGKSNHLYFAIEGKLLGAARSLPNGGRYSVTDPSCGVEYEITGDTVEIFTDELLTKKLCSFNALNDKVVQVEKGWDDGATRQQPARVATSAPVQSASSSGDARSGGKAGYSDSGNFRTFTPPGSTTIKPLTIPIYKGGICPDLPVAIVNRNSPEYAKQGSKERVESLALVNEIRRSVKLYGLLRNMKAAREYYNPEWLKENFDGKRVPGYGAQMHWASWFDLAKVLASEGLTKERLPFYFCTDGNCAPNEIGVNPFWGGARPTSQFAARRAFEQFLDNEMPAFLEWSDQIDFEAPIVLVGYTRASDYLFDEGGYVFNLNVLSSIFGTGESLRDLSVFDRRTFANKAVGTYFWKIDENKAEAIYERMHGDTLYYTYKVTLKFSEKSYLSGTYDVSVNNIQYDQSLASDSIDVFIGRTLDNLLLTIPVQ